MYLLMGRRKPKERERRMEAGIAAQALAISDNSFVDTIAVMAVVVIIIMVKVQYHKSEMALSPS